MKEKTLRDQGCKTLTDIAKELAGQGVIPIRDVFPMVKTLADITKNGEFKRTYVSRHTLYPPESIYQILNKLKGKNELDHRKLDKLIEKYERMIK